MIFHKRAYLLNRSTRNFPYINNIKNTRRTLRLYTIFYVAVWMLSQCFRECHLFQSRHVYITCRCLHKMNFDKIIAMSSKTRQTHGKIGKTPEKTYLWIHVICWENCPILSWDYQNQSLPFWWVTKAPTIKLQQSTVSQKSTLRCIFYLRVKVSAKIDILSYSHDSRPLAKYYI